MRDSSREPFVHYNLAVFL